MVTGQSDGGAAAFFQRVQFSRVGLGGHRHPMSGARGSMASSNYPLGLDHWRGTVLSGARHHPVQCPRKKGYFAPTTLFGLAINRGGSRPWASC